MPEVFVSIGSCFKRKENVRAAMKALRKRFGSIQYSSVYETEAVGFVGDSFYNLVVSFESDESPEALKQFFKSLERSRGRLAAVKTPGPVSLDLDLLLYGDLIIEQPGLKLPRVDVLQHAFVLKPLSELAPGRIYPGTQQTYAELWRDYQARFLPRGIVQLSWDPLGPVRALPGWCYPDYTQALLPG